MFEREVNLLRLSMFEREVNFYERGEFIETFYV